MGTFIAKAAAAMFICLVIVVTVIIPAGIFIAQKLAETGN